MRRQWFLFSALLVLCALKAGSCQDSFVNPAAGRRVEVPPEYEEADLSSKGRGVRTYLTPIEKTLKALMVPVRVLEDASNGIQKGIGSILSKIPGMKSLNNAGTGARQGFGDILNKFKDKFQAVYPGTYWCGAGNVAENDQELGFFNKTDACCRAHDSCKDGMAADEERNGLINNGIFTRSSCECDNEFYQCLKKAATLISQKIGLTYFTILRPQCFKKEYPVVKCEKYGWIRVINNKCEEYRLDRTKKPVVQWFDNPDF